MPASLTRFGCHALNFGVAALVARLAPIPAKPGEFVKEEVLMVMRNRHEGSDSSHWWDDLPPRLRNRFTQQNAEENERSDRNSAPLAAPPPPLSRSDVMFDLSRFAILFLLLVVVILLYLLLALSYIHDWQPAK